MRSSVGVALRFIHPCAAVGKRLDLSITGRLGLKNAPELSPYVFDPTYPDLATLSVPLKFTKKGKWSIDVSQAGTPIKHVEDINISDPETTSATLKYIVETFLSLLGLICIQIGLFAFLLVRSHSSTAAFLLLSDGIFSKFVNWPMFLVRHSRLVQLWVLEPWSQTNSRAVSRQDDTFLDVYLTSGSGETVQSGELISGLEPASRIWLLGPSGMGKTTIFYAWRRSFFENEQSGGLAAAAKSLGYILFDVRARDHASIPIDLKEPASWLVSVVENELRPFGFKGVGLIDSMLEAGHIAVAIEGLDEADTAWTIDHFCQTSPKVPLLVTSQEKPKENSEWDVWELPSNVSDILKPLTQTLAKTHRPEVYDRLAAINITEVLETV